MRARDGHRLTLNPSQHLAALLVLHVVLAAGHAGAGELATAHVALDVRWGTHAGSDELRDDLERALEAKLATACFTEVSLAGPTSGPPADLLLTVVLSEAEEEVRFDDAISTMLEPGTPDKELRRVARCAVTLDAALTTTAQGTRLASKRFSASASRRPVYIGEDPQAGARAQAVENSVRQMVKALGCGSAKLARSVASAIGRGPGSGAR